MSFVNGAPSSSSFEPGTRLLTRPKFNHQLTQDRLREAARRPTSFSMISNIRKDRRSVFKEVGLASEEAGAPDELDGSHAVADGKGEPGQAQRQIPPNTAEDSTATTHSHVEDQQRDETSNMQGKGEQSLEESLARQRSLRDIARSKTGSVQSTANKTPWYAKLAAGRRPRVRTVGGSSPSPLHGLSAVSMFALVLAVLIPFTGRGRQDTVGVADAGPIVLSRADSPTDVCARWAMQCE